MALAEAALMTGDKRYGEAAFKAATSSSPARTPTPAAGATSPATPAIPASSAWQLLALHDCELAGYHVPDQTKDRARQYIRSVSRGGTTCWRATSPPARRTR